MLLTPSAHSQVTYPSLQTITYNQMYKSYHRALKILQTLFKKNNYVRDNFRAWPTKYTALYVTFEGQN